MDRGVFSRRSCHHHPPACPPSHTLPPIPPFIHSTGQLIMRHGTLSSVATAALLLAAATPSVQASLLQQQQDPQEWKGNAQARALLR